MTKNGKRTGQRKKKQRPKKRLKAETDTFSNLVETDNVKLYVGNLSLNITTEKCREFFEPCGDIVRIVFFQKSKKQKKRILQINGYIIFTTEEAAEKAFSKHGQDLMGKSIIIRKLGFRQTKSLRLSNLSYTITEEKCREFFSFCGEIRNISLRDISLTKNKKQGKGNRKQSKGTGYITFATQEEADKAIAQSDKLLMDRPIIITYSLFYHGCRSVVIGNLPGNMDAEKIKKFFHDCGSILKIRFIKDHSAIVTFELPGPGVDKAVKKSGFGIGFMGHNVRVTYGKPPRVKPPGCKTVFIENFPKHVDEEQIRSFFADCGPISRINLLRNKSTRELTGKGFVSFQDPEIGVDSAIQKDGANFMGCSIHINYGKSPKKMPAGCKEIFVAKLSKEVNENMLERFFGDCGTISSVRVRLSKNRKYKIGFVKFENSVPAVCNAIERKNGKIFMGRQITVTYGKNSEKPFLCKSVFVTNLPDDVDDKKIKDFFGDCGSISEIRLVSGQKFSQRIAYVDFESTESVDNAIKKQGSELMGHDIRVEYNYKYLLKNKK